MKLRHPSERSYGPFILVEVEDGKRGRLWSFQFDGQERSEFDRFQNASKIRCHPQFDNVLRQLDDLANRSGFREQGFKHERYLDNVTGYPRVTFSDPKEYLKLRLYCMRFSLRALVLGPGCIKEGRGDAESYPGCESAIQRTHYAYRILKQAIREGLISIRELERGTLTTRRFGE